MKSLKILIIDDEKLIRWSFEKHLNKAGYEAYTAETGEEGIKLFELYYPEVVFVDNKLPKMQGLEVISKIKAIDEEAIIVFMTAYESIDIAVNAMKIGASEYLSKPFSNKEINIIIHNIEDKINKSKEILLYKRLEKDRITFQHIIGKSPIIRQTIQLAKKIALTDATTILLLGESGTGKDLLALAIHNESKRKEKPFVTISCSSLPDTLLESELFGYEKGAFTDAKKLKKGLFEIAEEGTVFLDEIGEINLSTQVKLLGVLENKIVRRLGGTRDIPVEIRIIAATNQDLHKSIENKTFREDLYYRLKVFQIDLPPLRERRNDIPLLTEYFIKLFNTQFRKAIRKVEPGAKRVLSNYNWPGNIRELRNVLERAVILQTNENLQLENLPQEIVLLTKESKDIKKTNDTIKMSENNAYSNIFNLPEEGISLNELEKQVLEQALKRANYNQTRASKLLRISRDTLRYKKKKHKL